MLALSWGRELGARWGRWAMILILGWEYEWDCLLAGLCRTSQMALSWGVAGSVGIPGKCPG